MKLVVWGLGFRGKTLVDYLGKKYVAAIIESDVSKIGQEYQGIQVISFEKYKEYYSHLLIIITPMYQFQKEISQKLIDCGIYHYVYFDELPSNISYNGKFREEDYLNMIDKEKTIYLYGINAFSVVLYFMLTEYVEKIKFVAEKENLSKNQMAISKLLQLSLDDKKEIQNSNRPIYITTHEYIDKIGDLFPQNKIIDAFRYADYMEECRKPELERFQNICFDKKRCFIVATGPSLTTEDLDVLLEKKEFCFSVNGICKVQTKWKPDVYIVSDGKFFEENQEEIRRYDCPIKLLPDVNIEFWKTKKEGEYQIHRACIDSYNVFEFTEDITKVINVIGTVVVGCIQIAVYMGFKEIYLLGTDCNYVIGSVNNYFGGDSKPDLIDHSVEAMIKGYQMCRDYADSHGIKIYNATRGGMLEVFERVDFDSLFEK